MCQTLADLPHYAFPPKTSSASSSPSSNTNSLSNGSFDYFTPNKNTHLNNMGGIGNHGDTKMDNRVGNRLNNLSSVDDTIDDRINTNTNIDSDANTNLNSITNTITNSNSCLTKHSNSSKNSLRHKRGNDSSISFGSDSTLVESENLSHTKQSHSISSLNSVSTSHSNLNKSSVKIDLSEEDEDQEQTGIASNNNELKCPLVPKNYSTHRTSKSENFTSKYMKKFEKNYPIKLNQLAEHQENDSFEKPIINHDLKSSLSAGSSATSSSFFKSPNALEFSKYNNHCSTPKCLSSFSLSTSASASASSSIPSSSHSLSPSFKLKRHTSSTDSLPVRTSNKLKDHKFILPEGCNLLSMDDSFGFIENSKTSIGVDGLPNFLIIDVRPFHDYCKSHIVGAINLCLPSTLLKRVTFSLDKCIQTLTNDEKLLFSKYLLRDQKLLPSILFYDNYSSKTNDISVSIYNLSLKFIKTNNWNSKLFILDENFDSFRLKYPNLTHFGSLGSMEKKKKEIIINSIDNSIDNSSSSSINDEMNSFNSVSPNSFNSPLSLTSPISNFIKNSDGNNVHTGHNSLGLSHFLLPDVSHIPFFKSRHNEEILTNRPDNLLHLNIHLTKSEINDLPNWLKNVIGNDSGSAVLTKKFNTLQIEERSRLNHALTKKNHFSNDSSLDSTLKIPSLSAGVELGQKNRYKDIFPYEHARVKIQKYDLNSKDLDIESSYINASYLSYPFSENNYIATQGPLNETIGDFWKVIYDHKIPLIFSLTPQLENKVEKCAPFWENGNYVSNGISINVELIEEIKDVKFSTNNHSISIMRRIKIKVGNLVSREVLQFHILSWPDYGIIINSEELINLVSLKKFITEKLNTKKIPILVHCSAGCGRTGCFCTIDTCIDMILENEKLNSKADENKDLIYDITSHFRSQRISMVQNLRQYMLIYDTILLFMKNREEFGNNGLVDWEIKDKKSLGILERFIKDYKIDN